MLCHNCNGDGFLTYVGIYKAIIRNKINRFSSVTLSMGQVMIAYSARQQQHRQRKQR